jgi:hypothetical protein
VLNVNVIVVMYSHFSFVAVIVKHYGLLYLEQTQMHLKTSFLMSWNGLMTNSRTVSTISRILVKNLKVNLRPRCLMQFSSLL